MTKTFDRTELMAFKGPFKDLKKNGFTFQRLYARNYMQWNFKNGIKYPAHDISIWKHLGGYVEIQDYGYLSKFLARAICTPGLLESYMRESVMYPELKNSRFLIVRETGETIKFEPELHESMYIFGRRFQANEEGIDEVITKWGDDFRENYRKVVINSDDFIIPKIQEMYAKGWINPFE